MFNDKFKLYYHSPLFKRKTNKRKPYDDDEPGVRVSILNTGIAWPTDKEYKFKNPPNLNPDNYVKPELWDESPWDLDIIHQDNNGYQNENFIVWMRNAAFPKFKKLWGRINHDGGDSRFFSKSLPRGTYTVEIDYR